MIAALNAGGTTIFLTTHYIEEDERLCGRIAFIVAGRVVRMDAVENLMREIQNRHIVEFAVSEEAGLIVQALSRAFPAFRCRPVSS